MIDILYKDSDILVCIKPAGLISEEGENSLISAIKLQTGEEAFAVHRLDTGVSGVMVYALNKNAAAALTAQIQSGTFVKRYLAVVRGTPTEKSGTYTDLLYHDRRKNKSFVVAKPRAGVKKAVLDYEVLQSKAELSLLQIRLHTGRTHQIRVQFSSRRIPLYGDGKYGGRSEKTGIALLSHQLSFIHPKTGKAQSFTAQMPSELPWTLFY